MVSPLSASMALGMITNGADDKTLAEMKDAFTSSANFPYISDTDVYLGKLDQFAYLITETRTGTVLFMGKVTKF